MKKRLPLFATHLRVGIAEHKSDRREEVTLSGAISSDDDVEVRRKGLDDGLILVAIARQSQH